MVVKYNIGYLFISRPNPFQVKHIFDNSFFNPLTGLKGQLRMNIYIAIHFKEKLKEIIKHHTLVLIYTFYTSYCIHLKTRKANYSVMFN